METAKVCSHKNKLSRRRVQNGNTISQTIDSKRTILDFNSSLASTVTDPLSGFEVAFQNAYDGMRLTDLNGDIVDVNDAYCKMTGMERIDLLGMPYYIVYSDTENEKIFRILKNTTFGHNTETADYKRLKVKFNSGNVSFLDLKYSVIKDGKQSPLLLTIFRDVTEQLKTEEALRGSQKLADLGKMASFFAHEIKSPVNTIKLHLENIKRQSHGNNDLSHGLELCYRETEHLETFLKDVLFFTRQAPLIKVNVNLNSLAAYVGDMLQPILHERNIKLINNAPNEILQADYQRLQTVFIHLVENALDAIADGGEIEILRGVYCPPGFVSVLVKDNGRGIRNGDKIFEPFYTTKKNGTGLGLSIAMEILKEHGGSIKLLSSRPGETVFEIMLRKEC